MNWSYFLVFTLLACGPTRVAPYSGGANATGTRNTGDQTGKNSPGAEINQESVDGTDTAQGERTIGELTRNEFEYLHLAASLPYEPQAKVTVPPIMQKRLDYLKATLKLPLMWKATYQNYRPDIRNGQKQLPFSVAPSIPHRLPKLYADRKGSDDHLPATPLIQSSGWRGFNNSFYPAVRIYYAFDNGGFSKLVNITSKVIDYLNNEKCPATITASLLSDEFSLDFDFKFTNGNKIEFIKYNYHVSGIGWSALNFWIGQDGKLKMAHLSKPNQQFYKFATFAECGVRIPELDYEIDFRAPDGDPRKNPIY